MIGIIVTLTKISYKSHILILPISNRQMRQDMETDDAESSRINTRVHGNFRTRKDGFRTPAHLGGRDVTTTTAADEGVNSIRWWKVVADRSYLRDARQTKRTAYLLS